MHKRGRAHAQSKKFGDQARFDQDQVRISHSDLSTHPERLAEARLGLISSTPPGLVSKRRIGAIRLASQKHWIKVKNRKPSSNERTA
jgi:hypothetical protein